MSDKLRRDFEAWVDQWCGSVVIGEHGRYECSVTQLSWTAWQASRAALVVELPEKWPLFTVDEVKDILDLAGVPYK